MMTRVFYSAPFQLSLAALAAILLVAGFVRAGRVRREAPGRPGDVELEPWEQEEFDRIETLYADSAAEPGGRP